MARAHSQGKEQARGADLIDLAGIRRALRQHWRGLLACMLVGVLVAAAWALTREKRYSAEASGIVSAGPTDNVGLGLAADSFAKSKATQYKVLAESPVVREAALKVCRVFLPVHLLCQLIYSFS